MSEIDAPATEERFQTKWLILGPVMLGSITGPLDARIVETVLPPITQFFHTEISIAQWVPTVYLLTISWLILLYGRLGDMIDYKQIFLYGLGAFTATAILCGLWQSIWMVISFRALQGLASGMVMAVSFAVIAAGFPPAERGKALDIGAIDIAALTSLVAVGQLRQAQTRDGMSGPACRKSDGMRGDWRTLSGLALGP
jgi:MFS family permease